VINRAAPRPHRRTRPLSIDDSPPSPACVDGQEAQHRQLLTCTQLPPVLHRPCCPHERLVSRITVAMLWVPTGGSCWQAPRGSAVALRRAGASPGVAHDVCSRHCTPRRTVRAHAGDADGGARTVELRTVATAVTRVLAAQLDQPQFAVDKLGMLPSETAATPDLVWVVRPPCTSAAGAAPARHVYHP
jgi:hypothetical protein